MNFRYYSLLFILLSFIPFTQSQAQNTFRIGYIDQEHIIIQMPQYKELKEIERTHYTSWINKMRQVYQEMQDLWRGCIRGEDAAKWRSQKNDQLEKELREMPELARKQFQRIKNEIIKGIKRKIATASAQVCKTHNFDIILNKSALKYAPPQFDLTKDVLKNLGIHKD
ncbi:hypothetical protein BKI52_16650 [marine bacterium AO1-C]|nr:hypothetical protein BKI52_16650 [marine bacterium AO1-C]